ncbi:MULTISPECIES: hypothetical protein [Paraprevotella]|uniref:hypothetical protein n=1 Tax=Paraprevotella TaxID=577309 RepID=UPI0022E8B12C|nr:MULTISPECIES: hypothetical protein [Paraprevotella]
MKTLNLICGFLVSLLLLSCNQDEVQVVENAIAKKSMASDDADWHIAFDVTEAFDTVATEIKEKILKHQLVAITVYGEERYCPWAVPDGHMGLVIGDDGQTCGFNVYLSGFNGDRIYIVSQQCGQKNSNYFTLPILFGIGSSLTYGALEFNKNNRQCYYRSLPTAFYGKEVCLFMIFATDYITSGYGYYKRHVPRHIDVTDMEWILVEHKDYKNLDLYPRHPL